MSALKLFLLGPPRVELDETPVEIKRRKALAMLAYLAATGQSHRRDTLATLFWPEVSQRRARANLRRVLSDLNQEIGEGILVLEGENVGLVDNDSLWLDMAQFRACLTACVPSEETCPNCLPLLAEAATLYQADFLAGFTLRDAPEFDDWQYFEAEDLRQALASALERLVHGHSAQGEYETAIPYARRWLALDPLHEPAQQGLIQLYHQAGQSSAALRQYELYVELLDEELGLPPAKETTALYEAIKANRKLGAYLKNAETPGSEGDENIAAVQAASPRHNLPVQPTPFIGREKEVAEISQLLRDEPGCRLLTLVGPGGMGKTRLALAAATHVGHAFSDGTHFVSLAPVGAVEFIVPAIAEALKFNFQGETDPKTQLLHHLGQKNYLLIIDNFEHLLSVSASSPEGMSGGEELLSEMLCAAAHLKLLVTSRERLNLQEEWGYDVPGMPFPQDTSAFEADPQGVEHYAAIQLFLQRARKAEASFACSTEDMAFVIRICRLVGGMPLGIELAAPWVRLMSCREIADEIECSFDLLATSLRNVPERHRSMRAILEQTWQQLPVEEQAILSKLSVFWGGCLREAAEVVTGATLLLLSSLVDKALLRRVGGGRYELHELIRQFALEQLQSVAEMYTQTLDRHYRYYTAFLQQQVEGLKGGPQLETLRLIAADIDNVRAAWQRAVEAKDRVALEQATECLYLYSELAGALAEGETAFRQAVAAFDSEEMGSTTAETSLRGFLLVGQGALRAHRGDLQRGQALLEQGLTLLDPDNDESSHLQKRAFALMWLGWVLFLQAKNTKVEQIIQESLALYTKIGDRWGVAKNLYILGNSLTGSGRLAEAEPPLRKSLAICQDIGDRRSRLLVDWNLAILTFWFGDYVQTEQLLTDAVLLGREFDDQIGLALALKELGKLEVAQGKYSQAIQTIQESIAITDEIGSQWESAATLDDLGVALCLAGDYAAAENVLRQCLEASQARQHRYFIARCFGDLGLVAYYKENYQQAEQHLQHALSIWMDLGHEPYSAWVLCQLGHVLQAIGQNPYAEGRQYYRQALQLSIKHGLAPFAMDTFGGVARLLVQAGELQKAVELLALVIHHPTSTFETKEMARKRLTDLNIDLSSEAVVKRRQGLGWQATAAELIEVSARPN